MIDGQLTIWTIYDHPDDFPDRFVVAVDVIGQEPTRQPGRWLADDLAGARAIVRANDPTADRRFAPGPDDAPCIVESWL